MADDDERTKLSKHISWILRRGARVSGVKQDDSNWVKWSDLCAEDRLREHDAQYLWQVVVDYNSPKKRYEISEKAGGPFIRAYERTEREVKADKDKKRSEKGGKDKGGKGGQNRESAEDKGGGKGRSSKSAEAEPARAQGWAPDPARAQAQASAPAEAPAPAFINPFGAMPPAAPPPAPAFNPYGAMGGAMGGAMDQFQQYQQAAMMMQWQMAMQQYMTQAAAGAATSSPYMPQAPAGIVAAATASATAGGRASFGQQAGGFAASVDANRLRGWVKSVNNERGFGFITCNETYAEYQRDVFVQAQHLQGLEPGSEVTFVCEKSRQGMPQARDVQGTGRRAPPKGKGKGQDGKGKDGKGKDGKGKDGKGKDGKGKREGGKGGKKGDDGEGDKGAKKRGFAVQDMVKVKTTGESGKITLTNGHAFKAAGKWYLAEELAHSRG